MQITPELFQAYLKCSMKCWLRAAGEVPIGNAYAEWVKTQDESYRTTETARLLGDQSNVEVASSPGPENLKSAKWKLATKVMVQALVNSWTAESNLHAVERVPSAGRGQAAQFIPIRFIFRNKLTKDDKLLLAFDAFVLSEMLGREVSLGKIIHGDDHVTLKVKTSALAGEVRKRAEKIAALLTSEKPPDLVLNRHCAECEFRDRCRQKAIETDDLSLLAGMSAKERQKLRSKGIFTGTQLSFTFRPRRRPKRLRDKREKYHHSLKALAIREKKIHIVGSPELKIEGTPVYLDVEGLPDRDFYYLIGLRIGHGESAVQHSLWADTVADEGKIWREFLAILETVEKPVLIHYGSYETVFLKQMSVRHGSPRGNSLAARAMDEAVNVVSVMYAQIYFPALSNGLKENAAFLGFKWAVEDPSGLHAIAWRDDFETHHGTATKAKLVGYNADDCLALKNVAEHLQLLLGGCKGIPSAAVAVDDLIGNDDLSRWGQRKFAIGDFGLMADCAYFDHQRSKIYIRSSPEMKQIHKGQKKRNDVRNKPNKVVLLRCRHCWRCKSSEIVQDTSRWHRKLQLDLRFSTGGIRRWITEFRTAFWTCQRCKTPCFPRSYKSQKRFGHNLVAWVVYQHISNRLSFENLRITLKECFGVRIPTPHIHGLKHVAAGYYKRTYIQIIENLVKGRLIHADETTMKLTDESGYVWVFTSLVYVAYVYRPNREGQFLHRLLHDFSGVLVSDFYSAYDSLQCQQQKCLVHLMWDINGDLLKNPFDEDLKFLAGRFGELLRNVISTVDRFGLKARFLRKHRKQVAQLYSAIELWPMASPVARHYRDRLLQHRKKLFVFLEHDGVPWNNNNAEHAIKRIAKFRPLVRRTMTRRGVESYLVLLSVFQTCKFMGVDFLDFLRSWEKDIHAFAESRRRRGRRLPTREPQAPPADEPGVQSAEQPS